MFTIMLELFLSVGSCLLYVGIDTGIPLFGIVGCILLSIALPDLFKVNQ